MIIRRITLLLFTLLSFSALARTEEKDSLFYNVNLPDSVMMNVNGKRDNPANDLFLKHGRIYDPQIGPLLPYIPARHRNLNIPDLYFTPGQATVVSWSNGEILATGGIKDLPGMMQIESGAVGIYQSAGRFTFYGGGIANKYGYFRGLHTQYGLNGSLTYQFSPRLSTVIYGEYYFGQPPLMSNGLPMPPSMTGYYGRSKFGFTFNYNMNEHWGVEVGAQTVQQFGTNRYQAEPVVTPYYRINKKVAIGVPVGQILYHILKK